MQTQHTPTGRDPQLWEIAQRRASFKSHFLIYLVMVGFFWLIWWFTGAHTGGMGLPWAVWPTLGWGLGVFFHYLGAYVFKENQVDREYEKLMREKNGQ
jgi:hypothetical protein